MSTLYTPTYDSESYDYKPEDTNQDFQINTALNQSTFTDEQPSFYNSNKLTSERLSFKRGGGLLIQEQEDIQKMKERMLRKQQIQESILSAGLAGESDAEIHVQQPQQYQKLQNSNPFQTKQVDMRSKLINNNLMCFEGKNCKMIIIIIVSIAVILGILDLALLKIDDQYNIKTHEHSDKPVDILNLPQDDDNDFETKQITNVNEVIDDYFEKIKHDEKADWENGTGTLKEKVSEIIGDSNPYAAIADSVNENEFNKLQEGAKVDANNSLDREEKENNYEIAEEFALNEADKMIKDLKHQEEEEIEGKEK